MAVALEDAGEGHAVGRDVAPAEGDPGVDRVVEVAALGERLGQVDVVDQDIVRREVELHVIEVKIVSDRDVVLEACRDVRRQRAEGQQRENEAEDQKDAEGSLHGFRSFTVIFPGF